VGWPGGGLVTALEPVDEVAALEDGGDEVLWSLPQPVATVPTAMAATAHLAMVTRANTSLSSLVDAQFDRGA
jgi:hypothetical protein